MSAPTDNQLIPSSHKAVVPGEETAVQAIASEPRYFEYLLPSSIPQAFLRSNPWLPARVTTLYPAPSGPFVKPYLLVVSYIPCSCGNPECTFRSTLNYAVVHTLPNEHGEIRVFMGRPILDDREDESDEARKLRYDRALDEARNNGAITLWPIGGAMTKEGLSLTFSPEFLRRIRA